MRISYVFAAAVVLSGATLASANVLANPGFEDPITFDGAPFIGSWEGFAGGGATSGNSTAFPRSGASHADLTINAADNTFAGVFQDVLVQPGASVTFSGYHMTPTSVLGVATEIRIEWRDAANEVGRTPNTLTLPSAAYTEFTLTATAPLNADRGRLVYAIQSFGGEPNPGNTGTVYLDDMSAIVPEPSSLALVAAFGLLRRTRR